MHRGETGRYEATIADGSGAQAFIPHPLPPIPSPAFTEDLPLLLERAAHTLGRLDAISSRLPDKTLFLHSHIRKEAVLSSQIEGTQSSLSDLMLFELGWPTSVPLDDVIEVSNYVTALQYGIHRLRDGFPLCNRLLREVHGKLMSGKRGRMMDPGEFRRSQNWIGGTRPGNARFVPPPHTAVPDCMSALEKFLHARDDGLPLLVRTAMAHVQFETIHPFLDGNGRVGRLLITFQLVNAGILCEPLLYLSLYFKKHQQEYYRMLDHVRRTGDWESWMVFFLRGVILAGVDAISQIEKAISMFQKDHDKLYDYNQKIASLFQIHKVMQKYPILPITKAAKISGLTYPTALRALGIMEHLGIAYEMTGKPRNRMFAYDQYLSILKDESGMEKEHMP